MKLRKLSQLALASGIGLAVAATLTACQLVTVDYVFLAGGASTTSGGGIQTLAVDSESGALRFANNTGLKPVDSGGASPVSMAVSGTYTDLYVANQGNNSVVHFTLAPDGTLTNSDSITLAEAPVSVAVSPDGSYLFVASGTDSATLTEYSLSSGKIGSVVAQESLTIPGYSGDTVLPTGVTTMANGAGVYVTVYDQSAYNPGGSVTSTANPGWVFGFAIGSGGALTAAPSPYRAGVKPSALVVDPSSRFVYVTDFASSQLIGYGISSGTALNFLISGPYRTGNQPSAVTIDPRGKFIYVANSLDSTVSAYAIDLGTGIPSASINTTGNTSNATDTQPNAIVVDPALARFVYTANTLGDSISGFKLNPNTGTIQPTQSTPYPADLKAPTAIVAVPHGNHSLQVVPQ
jgi:6-phosphogluconolactonase